MNKSLHQLTHKLTEQDKRRRGKSPASTSHKDISAVKQRLSGIEDWLKLHDDAMVSVIDEIELIKQGIILLLTERSNKPSATRNSTKNTGIN